MKNIFKVAFLTLVMVPMVYAGNEDRVGSAGASHLLINPWARSSAIGDAGYAQINGLEATYTNICLLYTSPSPRD